MKFGIFKIFLYIYFFIITLFYKIEENKITKVIFNETPATQPLDQVEYHLAFKFQYISHSSNKPLKNEIVGCIFIPLLDIKLLGTALVARPTVHWQKWQEH